jgi:hypothetical protein
MAVNTALHGTNVDFVWPTALVRPSGVQLVYLDQNHWIYLAQAAAGRPHGRPYRDALTELREARRAGRAVFPLSLTHLMEMSTITRRQRGDVASVMEELSGFTSLIARDIVLRVELEAVLDANTKTRRSIARLDIVTHGLVYAYGRTGRFRITDGQRDLTDEARARIGADKFDTRFSQAEEDLNRGILRGPADDVEEAELRAAGWNPEVVYKIGDDRAQAQIDLASRLGDETLLPDDPTDYRRERVRDVLRAWFLAFEMLAMLSESFGARGIEPDDVFTDVEISQRLFDAMPSADVAVTLLAQYHRDPTFQWKRNHVFDIDAMSVAVPYCDIVATDKQTVDALRRHRVADRTRSKVVHSLDDVVSSLTEH